MVVCVPADWEWIDCVIGRDRWDGVRFFFLLWRLGANQKIQIQNETKLWVLKPLTSIASDTPPLGFISGSTHHNREMERRKGRKTEVGEVGEEGAGGGGARNDTQRIGRLEVIGFPFPFRLPLLLSIGCALV